jgi:glutamyl-tRNA synthetase
MVRTRIAPSPTGDPHIGTAYTALFNYAFAKREKGKFILRIEDTDRQRLVQGASEKILESLNWLGLKPDEGPFIQSQRLVLYKKSAKDLVEKGKAYYCDCTSERLGKLRVQQQEKGEVPRYDRKCRFQPPKDLKEGSFVVRLKVPETGETIVEDMIRGEIKFQNKDIDDSVLLKSDGWPTYHLAVVVDDHDMKITHVLRAEEWLSSTPKHILLYKAFGYEVPKFAHLALLRNPDKSKISKRKNPVSLEWYKKEGYLPQALLNYLALMGWSMPSGKEIFSLAAFIENFDISRLGASGPVFDLQKLSWLNGEWIRSLSDEELVKRLKEYTNIDVKEIGRILPLVKERLKKLSEFDSLTSYFFADTSIEKDQISPKGKTDPQTSKALQTVRSSIENLGSWKKEELEKALEGLPQHLGWSKTDLFQTIRYVETASRSTPPLFDTLEAIGRETTLKRLGNSIDLLTDK